MKKLLSLLLAIIVSTLTFGQTAKADTPPGGAKVFSANCAACHMGGCNVVAAAKTLKADALEKYNMKSLEAIVTQVKNGKKAMPSFKGRLNDSQIEAVAAYVLEQAEKGWT